jgi:Fe-S cluster assembly ATPase SufC
MISSLSIGNFKSIKQLQCDFPQFAAIVGKNAAGKTNILQAIAIVKELTSGDPVDSVLGKIVLAPAEIFNKETTEKISSLGVKLTDKDGTEYQLKISLRLVNGNVPANFVISHERLEVHKDGNVHLVYERKENQAEDGNGNAIPTIDPKRLLASLFQGPEAEAVRAIFMGVRIPDPQLMDSRDAVVGITEKNLAGLLIQLRHNEPQLYVEFEKVTKKLLPTFASIKELAAQPAGAPASEEQYMILFEEKHLRGQLSVKLLSAGDVRTLYIIAVAIGMQEYGTLILEEIENGIHQKRIQEIIDHLEQISLVKNVQVLFTTHSERVVNRIAPQKVLYVEKDLTKGTRLIPLSGAQELADIQAVLSKGGSLSDYLSTSF